MSILTALPTVLVIGDFETNAEFGLDSWQRIREQYLSAHGEDDLPHPPIRPATFAATLSARSGDLWEALNDQAFAAPWSLDRQWPYPIPLSHGCPMDASSRSFSELLLDYLTTYNVVAIIASGPAAQTQSVLTVTRHLGVPVVVTVDSTAGIQASDGPRVRRLMPSNHVQAQVIASRVAGLVESNPDGTITLFAPTLDPYAADLYEALHEQLSLIAKVEVSTATTAIQIHADDSRDIVVCIGYPDALAQLLAGQATGAHLILTDGCCRPRTIHMLNTHLAGRPPSSSPRVYWTLSSIAPDTVAERAYTHIAESWCALWRERIRTKRRYQSLLPPGKAVHLTPGRYRCRGVSAYRGAYLVEWLSDERRAFWTKRFFPAR